MFWVEEEDVWDELLELVDPSVAGHFSAFGIFPECIAVTPGNCVIVSAEYRADHPLPPVSDEVSLIRSSDGEIDLSKCGLEDLDVLLRYRSSFREDGRLVHEPRGQDVAAFEAEVKRAVTEQIQREYVSLWNRTKQDQGGPIFRKRKGKNFKKFTSPDLEEIKTVFALNSTVSLLRTLFASGPENGHRRRGVVVGAESEIDEAKWNSEATQLTRENFAQVLSQLRQCADEVCGTQDLSSPREEILIDIKPPKEVSRSSVPTRASSTLFGEQETSAAGIIARIATLEQEKESLKSKLNVLAQGKKLSYCDTGQILRQRNTELALSLASTVAEAQALSEKLSRREDDMLSVQFELSRVRSELIAQSGIIANLRQKVEFGNAKNSLVYDHESVRDDAVSLTKLETEVQRLKDENTVLRIRKRTENRPLNTCSTNMDDEIKKRDEIIRLMKFLLMSANLPTNLSTSSLSQKLQYLLGDLDRPGISPSPPETNTQSTPTLTPPPSDDQLLDKYTDDYFPSL